MGKRSDAAICSGSRSDGGKADAFSLAVCGQVPTTGHPDDAVKGIDGDDIELHAVLNQKRELTVFATPCFI